MKFFSIERLVLATALTAWGLAARAQTQNIDAVPGEYVVYTKRQSPESKQVFEKRLSDLGLKIERALTREGSHLLLKVRSEEGALRSMGLALSAKKALGGALLKELRKFSDLEMVEPNFIYRKTFGSRPPAPTPRPTPTPTPVPTPTPDDPEDALPQILPRDPSFASLWAFRNTAQVDSTGRRGKAGADSDITNAWAITQGSKSVVVAIVDSGVDYNHPDLRGNMWSLPGQPNVHGYNAIKDNFDPMDDDSHGTHVAGTIGALMNNGIGVVGVSPNVSLMAIKFLDASGSGTLANAIKGIDWARQHGARIINNSWGGGGFSQALLEAIQRTRDDNILFVVAAGNTARVGNNNDSNPSYPANYAVENIISVAATNNLDQVASFSHYGVRTVHLAAPGENILSTFPNNSYESISGTSMAAPHVSGAAALLLAQDPTLTATQLKQKLLSTVDKLSVLSTKVSSGGRLNVYKALRSN